MQKRLSIQESSALDYSGPSEVSSFKIVRKVGGAKRQKTSHLALPEVHTFHATEVSVQSAWELRIEKTDSSQGFSYPGRSGERRRLCKQVGQAGAPKSACGSVGRPASSKIIIIETFR